MNEIKNTECQVIGNTLIKNENPLANGIIKRKEHFNQKYNVDFSWFDNKNTKEFAYFLGFFYADGSNNEHNGHLTISLKENDKEILEQFSSLFFGNRPVYVYNAKCQTNNSVRIASLTVVNKSLSKIMLDCGAMQCKTFKIRFPYWLDKSLYKHFIRGYFDGDGCLSYTFAQRNNFFGNSFLSVVTITSTEDFCLYLSQYIKGELGINSTLLCRHPENHNNNRTLQISGNKQVIRLMDWLYKDTKLYLKRKYEKLLVIKETIRKRDLIVHEIRVRNGEKVMATINAKRK